MGLLIVLFPFIWAAPRSSAQQIKKPFTVADDIEMTFFHTIGKTRVQVQFSPDGKYFAAFAERGRLDLNRVEDSLRFYSSREVEEFLDHSDMSEPPLPVWIVNRSDKEGPVINDWRWLADSSGVAFLEGGGDFADKRVVLADLRKKKTAILTPTTETVENFQIHDPQNFVYTVADPDPLQKLRDEHQAAVILGTGRSIHELIFPDDPIVSLYLPLHSQLCAIVAGKRLDLKTKDAPLVPEYFGFALSPDGQSVVTQQVIPDVPAEWETLYPSPDPSYPYRIRAGRQDLRAAFISVRQYVLIHLQTGSVQSLTDAPESDRAGWKTWGRPTWSSDGQAILLPGTFLPSKDRVPSRPCVAVVDLESNTHTCVEPLAGLTDTRVGESQHDVTDVRFVDGDKHRVMVSFRNHSDHRAGSTEYRSTTDGTWRVIAQTTGESEVRHNGMEIKVEEGFDQPPRLVARTKQASRVIWDPNPQLTNMELGQVSVYKWKDKEGRERRGGLYKPSNYEVGKHYPLVIQTHGFVESEFRPSGLYPTAFVATELATSGIVVLQVEDGDCVTVKPDEGPCAVSAYETAARQLVSEGLVDPEKIGIIGFSRTCFYVMETLTTSSLHLEAALITDGILEDYFQYILNMGTGAELRPESDSIIGAKPAGEGLRQWLKRSPGFNLDKVNTPLLVVGEGPSSLLYMWGAYAGLRYLQKPVDLIMLNTHEHVLTNPAVRMASQGRSVDWFRFWLRGEEDPEPAKAEEYRRWHELQKAQQKNEHKLVPPLATSN